MAQKSTQNEWYWNPQREQAAVLVAHDQMSDDQIAATLSISRTTLLRWKAVSEFSGRVDEHVAAARAAIRAKGIAIVENRIARKQADWERLEQIRLARADAAAGDADWAEQGGDTGLIVRKQRALGQGPLAIIVTDYAIDTAYLAERDRLEEAVARELGQRVEKHEVETRDLSVAEGLDVKIEALARRLNAAAERQNADA